MARQLALSSLLLLAAVFTFSGCGCKDHSIVNTAPRDDGINVVFVSFDALQAAHVSSLGYPRKTTPTIDAMADSGFNFTNAISVSSWTVPSSMTWFTGIYPSEHRMTNKFSVYNANEQRLAKLRELSPNVVTLAEILKHNGYATVAFTGNAGVNGGFGFEEGFDVYEHEAGTFGSFDRSIPAALNWLKENRDQKFFLFLHGYDVHGQSTPAGGFDFRFVDQGYDRKFTGSEQEQERLREEGLEKGQLTLRDEDVRFWRTIYDEKIQRTDEKFRQFLVEFEKLGLMDKTLFVLTSDHGTEIYEHRRFDHGYSLYNELIHIPLAIKLPKQAEGKKIRERVSSIDLMPTILDFLNLSLTDVEKRQLRGRSLVPMTRGEATSRDVFSETDYRQYTYKRSITSPDGWKLIYTLENRRVELYDLNADPGELNNLVEATQIERRVLEEKLFKHFASIGHDLGTRRWEIGLNPVYSSQGTPPKKK